MSGIDLRRGRSRSCRAVAAAALLATPVAHASFLSGDALAKAADVLTIIVLIIVPIVAVTLFWMAHILPEKIAHRRKHPQAEAIQVLCLLSLIFGGLLWPFAMLWAFTKPVLYRMAYGTDKSDEHGAPAPAAPTDAEEATLRADVSRLTAELDRLASSPGAPMELHSIREQLAALEPRLAAGEGTR